MSEHVTRIVHEGDLEVVICSECGSDNVLTGAEDCVECEKWRTLLLDVRPDLADLVCLKPA